MTSVLRTNAAFTARTRPLVGDIKHSFAKDDHLGWLRCDGRALNKNEFTILFEVIGYAFGGCGNTFYLPNAEGRVIGNTGYVMDENEHDRTFEPGDVVGELDHRLTVCEMPAHNHNHETGSTGDNTTANGTTSSNGDHHHTYQDAFFAENTQQGQHRFGTNANVDTDNDLYYRKTDGGYTANANDAGTQISTSSASAHTHQIASNGGDHYHNNIQPTIFIGSTYMYSGIPGYGYYPFTTGRNPVLI